MHGTRWRTGSFDREDTLILSRTASKESGAAGNVDHCAEQCVKELFDDESKGGHRLTGVIKVFPENRTCNLKCASSEKNGARFPPSISVSWHASNCARHRVLGKKRVLSSTHFQPYNILLDPTRLGRAKMAAEGGIERCLRCTRAAYMRVYIHTERYIHGRRTQWPGIYISDDTIPPYLSIFHLVLFSSLATRRGPLNTREMLRLLLLVLLLFP